jgi:hypothetical protein
MDLEDPQAVGRVGTLTSRGHRNPMGRNGRADSEVFLKYSYGNVSLGVEGGWHCTPA